MPKNYETSKIAVDPVIFTIHENKLKVFMHTREKEPFIGKKELPGGLLLPEETAEETLKRKLHELFGSNNFFFTQFYTFTKPKRDPRERTVSIGFVTLINSDKINNFENWHEYEKLKDTAFDHKEIVENARKYIKENISSHIVKHFMPQFFPLNNLQEVYEMIEGIRYDNRNFRKKMINRETVEETKQMEQDVSHRPAKLFKFK